MDTHGTIRVRRGNPGPEDLAVLAAVLAASAAAHHAQSGGGVPYGRGAARWRRYGHDERRPEPRSWRRAPGDRRAGGVAA